MFSRDHIIITKEQKPSWLQLSPNESFVGQGKFKRAHEDNYSDHWVIKSLSNEGELSYFALHNRSKVRLDTNHAENAIRLIKDPDDSGKKVFDYDLSVSRPMPLPLIDVLSVTDRPNVYAPAKVHLLIDINDNGDVMDLEWGEFTINLPRPADRTSNVMPTLAWDNADYAIPSDKKHHQAWRQLLLNGVTSVTAAKQDIFLSSSLDLTDPAISALIKFLNSGKSVDLSGKPKSLIKPRVCYRYRKTGKFIPHCNSIRAMAKELLGGMDEMVTQSPMLALEGNAVRIFNTPPIDNISYGIIPKLPRGVILSAFDEMQRIKSDMIKIGDIGVMLYRGDGNTTPLITIFKQLARGIGNDEAADAYSQFTEFTPSDKHQYKLIALDLTSKGSVRCSLATKFDESYFYESLKRSLILTTTSSSKKPIPFARLSAVENRGRTLQNIKYIIGMDDAVGYQLISDVKTSFHNSNDYEFYMRKHFLKAVGAWG